MLRPCLETREDSRDQDSRDTALAEKESAHGTRVCQQIENETRREARDRSPPERKCPKVDHGTYCESLTGLAQISQSLLRGTSSASTMQRYDSIPRDSFLNHQAALKKKWADVAKNDPRRVIRILSLNSPTAETVEGDEFSEIPLLFEELGTLSKQSTSKTWKGLVNAGIITALWVDSHRLTYVL